ncbi:VWA domain-containing protein, partial [bacterium]|nr:VWA domain-containing protein [bacterium]
APRDKSRNTSTAGKEALQSDGKTAKSGNTADVTSKVGNPPPEDASGNPPGNKIAVAGSSLDLYAIIDVSGSLNQNDPSCTRLAALKAFFSDLRKVLGTNPDARLSLTIFSSTATFIGTDNGFLQLSDNEFDDKYRRYICQANGNTNISQAFNLTREKALPLIQNSPKKVASVLIFTDGFPTDMPLPIAAAAQLRDVFPNRVFGILLGSAGMIFGGNPEAFINQVTGATERVRRVDQVNDLATALSSFIK